MKETSVAVFLREMPYFALHALPREKLQWSLTLFMALPLCLQMMMLKSSILKFILIQTLYSLYVTIPLLANIQQLAPGSLYQTNKCLTTANGTGSCLQKGTITISPIDDNGTRHAFILDSCLYHPNSPLNLLFTRRLTEKFIDANGNPDKETRIESGYSTHVFTWSFGQFQKTFPTPISGLPKLLFNEGFQEYKSFCTRISSFVNSVSSSNDSADVNVNPFNEDKVHVANDAGGNDINTLFMRNESFIFKDGKGITLQVNYLGPHIVDKILKHKICTEDGTYLFIDAILLSSINTPDIGPIPVTAKHVTKLPKLLCQQIEQISNPEIVDDDQREFMGLHCKMNHLPFPAMIHLAGHNRVNKKVT